MCVPLIALCAKERLGTLAECKCGTHPTRQRAEMAALEIRVKNRGQKTEVPNKSLY